jgi:outer membrane protein
MNPMTWTSRSNGLLATLCLVSAVGTATAQNPAPGPKPPATPAGAPSGAFRVGAIDMDKVFEGYEKASFLREQIKQAIVAKNGELTKIMSSMRQIAKEMEGLDPTGNDFKTKESEITKLKAQYEAERDQAQTEFARRDAEALATIYKDVQDMTSRVARQKGLQFVVKVSSQPPTATDPNSVLAAISQSVVFHDPSLDVTSLVVYNLNLQYKSQGGATVPPTATGANGAPTDRATTPASATGPAPRTPATTAAGAQRATPR